MFTIKKHVIVSQKLPFLKSKIIFKCRAVPLRSARSRFRFPTRVTLEFIMILLILNFPIYFSYGGLPLSICILAKTHSKMICALRCSVATIRSYHITFKLVGTIIFSGAGIVTKQHYFDFHIGNLYLVPMHVTVSIVYIL